MHTAGVAEMRLNWAGNSLYSQFETACSKVNLPNLHTAIGHTVAHT